MGKAALARQNIDHQADDLEFIRQKSRVFRRGQYQFFRIQNPSTALTKNETEILMRFIVDLTRTIYPFDTQLYWRDRGNFISEVDEIWVIEYKKQWQGWCAFCWWNDGVRPRTVVYIDTLNLSPHIQKCGLGGIILYELWINALWKAKSPPVFIGRTQTPVIYQLSRSLSPASTYPKLKGKPSAEALFLARHAAQQKSPDKAFDPEKFIIRRAHSGAYGIPEKGNKTVDKDVARFFEENINVDQGDAIILVFVANWLTVLRALVVWLPYRIIAFFNISRFPGHRFRLRNSYASTS